MCTNAWDGVEVVSVLAANVGSFKSLWGLCREVDAVAGRRLTLNHKCPKAVQQRLLKMLEHQKRLELAPLKGETVGNSSAAEPSQGLQGVGGELCDGQRRFLVTAATLEAGDPYWVPYTFSGTEVDNSLVLHSLRVLPPSVKHLRLGNSFNCYHLRLPDWLQSVHLGDAFDGEVTLPHALRELSFGELSKFNRPVDLPPSLRKIVFGEAFGQGDVILPDCLEELRLGRQFDQTVALPSSLRKITFQRCTFHMRFDDFILPSSLEEAVFGEQCYFYIPLPSSLRKITFLYCFNEEETILPEGLEVLKIGDSHPFNRRPVTLPASLRTLELGRRYRQPLLASDLPAALERLVVWEGYKLPDNLPEGLEVEFFQEQETESESAADSDSGDETS